MTGLLMSACLLAAQPEYEPTSNYELQEVEQFTVYVNCRLLGEKRALGAEALKLLTAKLHEINRTVPEAALAELHKVPVWVEVEDERHPGGCYHPSKDWLIENGFNPEKARSVEIGNAANFLTWSLHQPSMVLHEFAHAYHHRVLGYDNEDIKDAYRQAVESGSYESVLRYDGETARAYALNSDQEYFAELTEAFFGTNDFYPFVRAEIQRHDPLMYETLKKLWGE
jgi:hypothetical protein